MRALDFSSWHSLLSTVLALGLITLIGVGVRLLLMQTFQERRQRENRQINERLRTLIAAYKTLGGSFTGDLEVDPSHLRDIRRRAATGGATTGDESAETEVAAQSLADAMAGGSDRARRIRDAVEAALSDILLLGTEEQVRLAAQAASELVAGRRVHVGGLVASLRDFVRDVLDLESIPPGLSIPRQGPTRPGAQGKGGGRDSAGRKGEGEGGGGGGSGGGGSGGGGAGGGGLGLAAHENGDEEHH